MDILMAGFSKTGNTYMFMDYLKKFNNNIDEYRFDINEYIDLDVKDYDLIIVGSNTWGDGKIPKSCKQFIIDNATKYNKKWIVFGTGNSIFAHFCEAVDSICKILNDTNNTVLETFKYEQRFLPNDLDSEQEQQINNIVTIISE